MGEWEHRGNTCRYSALMASLTLRKNKAGHVTSYQVKWRDGGSASGDWQTERFDDEPSAKVFKEAVEEVRLWPLT
ncbi:hypothetical protein ABID95_001316 [Streptomyces atratus]